VSLRVSRCAGVLLLSVHYPIGLPGCAARVLGPWVVGIKVDEVNIVSDHAVRFA